MWFWIGKERVDRAKKYIESNMEKLEIVRHILRDVGHGRFVSDAGGFAWAPSNVALCKYWGKRDAELNLPVTSSLSVSLGNKGASALIRHINGGYCVTKRVHHLCENGAPLNGGDNYTVNGEVVGRATKFAERLKKFLDLFRPTGVDYSVEIITNVPIAAGFASSACGFASMVQALNQLYGWRLHKSDLSILARLGSGSACRSIFEGFVEWQRGEQADGMDSHGIALAYIWPELRLGMLAISNQEKSVSSRDAMQHTIDTSSLYMDWPIRVEQDLSDIKTALANKDFMLLGRVAENNAIAMHAAMESAIPPIIYSLPETFAMIEKVQQLRLAGVPVFFTQDAGPNLQLLFLSADEPMVVSAFPGLEVVSPFIDNRVEQVVLVDSNDAEIGTGEKLSVHIQGKLHRAFSVVILREKNGEVEMLLHQRASSKYHSANLWSNTCCGHPRPGEDLMVAAKRRLREEMGFGVELKKVGTFQYNTRSLDTGLSENELDHVLVGYSDLEDFSFDPSEVQNYCWVEIGQLRQDIQDNPHRYTVWLPLVMNSFCERSGLIE